MMWLWSSWNNMILAPGLILRFDGAKIEETIWRTINMLFPFDCAEYYYVDCSSDFSWRPTIRPTTCSSNRSFSAKPQANGRPLSRPTCLSNRSFTAMIFKAHHGRQISLPWYLKQWYLNFKQRIFETKPKANENFFQFKDSPEDIKISLFTSADKFGGNLFGMRPFKNASGPSCDDYMLTGSRN